MANIQPRNLRLNVCGLLAFTVLGCLTLTACSSAEKTTTTTVQTPGATVTTTTSGAADTDAGKGASASIDARREVEPNQPIDANNTAVEMGTESPADKASDAESARVRINMPGVHVNVDKASGKEDIDMPLVHIHKDGQGNTNIKAPFVHINTKDGDSQ
jgi:hypothetical protein